MKSNSFVLAVVGLSFLATSAPATVRYVNVNNASPVSPYTNWATAATDIQSAVDAASAGDLVLVTNGVYATGSREAPSKYLARVVVAESITLKSLNGPAVTIIKGYQVPGTTNGAASVRCVYLPDDSTLSGFTLTNGSTSGYGGGIYVKGTFATVSNCVIVGNAASLAGGGGYGGCYVNCVIRDNVSFANGGGIGSLLSNYVMATNCLIAGNVAANGGGIYGTVPMNCTIVGNTASVAGGGVYGGSVMKNSIVYYNFAPTGSNYYSTKMSYCCTVPIDSLSNSFTNEPLFVNPAAGDFHLQTNSRCLDAGANAYVKLNTDLDGYLRIVGSAVDLGPYELQTVLPESGTRYVNLNNPNPESPYLSWDTAATGIQAAIDVANPGELVLVTNGVYQTGGRAVYGVATNRVTMDKAVTVQSVNGPGVTMIQGSGGASQTAGIRCAYLTNGAVLIGFTLDNGSTRTSGNITNEMGGGGVWCESSSAIVSNCVFTRNYAVQRGGAAFRGTLIHCVVSNNAARFGGGVSFGVAQNCLISSNTAHSAGYGGGGYSNLLVNCVLKNNLAQSGGGGTYYCTLLNCTVVSNTAWSWGGGVYGKGAATNCIVYYNNAPKIPDFPNNSQHPLNYCETTTLATNGVGNIDGAPLFMDLANGNFHLKTNSPGINAGDNAAAAGDTDFDGNERIFGGTVDMGAYEFQTHIRYVRQNNLTPASPYLSWSTAATNIQDAIDRATDWDLILVSNGVYATGGRAVYGVATNRVTVDKILTVQSVNGPEVTMIEGAGGASQTAGIRCAYLTGGAVLTGFTLTKGAARISGNIYKEQSGGGVWCESVSAIVSNCVLVGNYAYQLGGGAFQGTLDHCAISNNLAVGGGGGAYDNTLINCMVISNTSLANGGGIYAGNLVANCLILGNSAQFGGGMHGGIPENCTIAGNMASVAGGGIYSLSPKDSPMNCIVYYNTAPSQSNHPSMTMNYCCTVPLASGPGNITNAPLFVNTAAGNFRLQSNSPCINTGHPASAPGSTDLEDNPRIAGGTVDIGAYEFQSPASVISYAYLQQYGLPMDGTVDYADSDGDGMNNWQEWQSGTIPTNILSLLQMTDVLNGISGTTVTWQSVSDRTYFLLRSDNLAAEPAFSIIASNLVGEAGTTSYLDPTTAGTGPCFYRVGVQR
jgi:hypothetical protein